jgi:hypothetical protein
MRQFPVVVLMLALLPGSRAAEPADERLLLGFEDTEFEKLAKVIKLTKKEGKTKDGKPFVSWQSPAELQFLGQWNLFKGNASQGDYAMGISRVIPEQLDISYSPVKFKVPGEPQLYYNLLNNNYATGGAMLHTCGIFRRIFPVDWSAYDLLRIDVYAEEGKQTVRILLEDEDIAPPILRDISVEPGKWATLEVDLRAAAKERGLDLKRMATLTVGVAKWEGKVTPGKPYSALIDNVRLCRRNVAAKLPVVADASAHKLPDYYRAVSKPEPEKLPGERADRTPLKLEKPFVIATETACTVAPLGWAGAYDNQRLLLGFTKGNTTSVTNVQVLQSLDGGQSWRGLDGGDKATGFYVNNVDHGTGRSDVVGARADVLVFTNLGCRGPSFASLRLFARKLTFTGKGWEVREVPDVVDCDLRHCNANHSIVRTADGRLWAAYGMVGRLGVNCINLRYSDDDGLTWKGWAEGKSGLVPGSAASEEKGVGFGYTFEEPCLVPFGKGVACIWQERHRTGGYSYDKLKWAQFDGQAWSALEEIEQPKRVGKSPVSQPPTRAVSLGGKEIFLTSTFFNGVLHYQDGKWQTELADVPPGSQISVAGDKTIVVIAAVSEAYNKGPVVLRSWQRSADGRWSAAVDLAKEDQPLSYKHDNIYVLRPALVVQRHAPANFVPIAWTCEGQKWIKFLRVPVAN